MRRLLYQKAVRVRLTRGRDEPLTIVNTGVTITSVERQRTSADLDIYVGKVRSFEWYWNGDGNMPGLDAFEDRRR